MTTEEVLKYLAQRLDLLQRKVTELHEQREEIERQIKIYKELFRYYRAVYETERGVGIQAQLSPEIIRIIEEGVVSEKAETKVSKVSEEGLTIPRVVFEILSEEKVPLHCRKLCQLIVNKYPTFAKGVKNLEKQVGSALVRGYQKGVYERTAPNTYRLKEGIERLI